MTDGEGGLTRDEVTRQIRENATNWNKNHLDIQEAIARGMRFGGTIVAGMVSLKLERLKSQRAELEERRAELFALLDKFDSR